MLFLVKRDDGIFIQKCRPLEVIQLDSLENGTIRDITADDLDGPTIDQMKALLSYLGVKTNAAQKGKTKLTNHIVRTWGEISEMGMGNNGIRSVHQRGSPKVIIIETNDGLVPVKAHNGQVFLLDFLRSLTPRPLTADDLKGLTVDEMKYFVSNIADAEDTAGLKGMKKKDDVISCVIDTFEAMEGAVSTLTTNTPDDANGSSDESDESPSEQSEGEPMPSSSEPVSLNEEGEKKTKMSIRVEFMGFTLLYFYFYKDGETFSEIADNLPMDISKKIGKDFQFRIGQSFIEGWETASSILSPEMNTVQIVPKLKGGARGVIKSKLKKPTPENLVKVNESHEAAFKSAFASALEISKAQEMKFEGLIKTLSASEMIEMREFLKGGKTKKALKVPKLVESCPAYKSIKTVQDMLASAIHILQDGFTNSVEREFGNGKEIDFDKMLEVLNVAIGKAQSASESAPMAD
eukprot:Skav207819  [mRNA]  locus=scaffold3429:12270:13658:+ [translate_table: standard]